MHAIGDAAFNQAARALKAALDDCPRSGHRHGIIHAFLPTDEGISICSEYGIQLPMQTACVDFPLEPGWYLNDILGKRAAKLNPIRTFLNNNITLSLGSDSPVTIPDPIMWIHGACNLSGGRSAAVSEALKIATYNGYWSTFDEKMRGSLEAGKIADMVILSENPYDVPAGELKRIKVEKLLLSGKPYRKQKQNIAWLLVKGLLSKKRV
jgi:predicted amidohydrolase YtcJ